MLGGEYYNYDEFQFEAKTQNSPIDDIPTLNVGAKQTYTPPQELPTAFFPVSDVSITTMT